MNHPNSEPRSLSLTIDDLFTSPDHFLFMFEGDHAVFLPMDRAAYRRSIFLDDRIDPVGDSEMKVPLDMLINHPGATASPTIGWIFHVAHCGSTLLARGLDAGNPGLVLREPLPLRQLAVAGAQSFAGRPANYSWRTGLHLAVAMLAKRYDTAAGPPTLVKANVPVNFILPELMALDPAAPGLLLHFGFDDYLAAILRSPEHRDWVRSVTAELRPAIEVAAGSIDGLGDASLAAALWLAQMRLYAEALARWPQLRSLDADALLNDPAGTIAAAAAYFGTGAPAAADIAALASSYAKNPAAAFDNAARLARRREARMALSTELAEARQWLTARLADYPLPVALDRPLVGGAKPLLD